MVDVCRVAHFRPRPVRQEKALRPFISGAENYFKNQRGFPAQRSVALDNGRDNNLPRRPSPHPAALSLGQINYSMSSSPT